MLLVLVLVLLLVLVLVLLVLVLLLLLLLLLLLPPLAFACKDSALINSSAADGPAHVGSHAGAGNALG